MNPKTFQLLQEADWPTIYKKLILYAEERIHKYRNSNILPLGYSVEDIVQDVIIKTLSGQRTWDPSRGQLLPTLKAQIKSEIDHLYNRKASKSEISFSSFVKNEQESDNSTFVRSPRFRDEQTYNHPEKTFLAKEHQQEQIQRYQKFLQLTETQPELQEVVIAMYLLIENGSEPKPRNIAEYLDISVKQVYNRLKRLKRLVLKGGI